MLTKGVAPAVLRFAVSSLWPGASGCGLMQFDAHWLAARPPSPPRVCVVVPPRQPAEPLSRHSLQSDTLFVSLTLFRRWDPIAQSPSENFVGARFPCTM
jgi:hypothetical protein